MRAVAIVGVGMHPFGKFPDKRLRELAKTAVDAAVADAGCKLEEIEVAYVGNAYEGILNGQESIRAQVVLRHAGLSGIPMMSVENACASGSSAFREAWAAVASGLYDVALALGVEKMFVGDTDRTVQAIATSSDVDRTRGTGFTFTGMYGESLRRYMGKTQTTAEHFAKVTVKNRANAVNNPYSQYRQATSVEDVLNSRTIAGPLTLLMCAPIGDGAAAAIVCTAEKAREFGRKPIWVKASAWVSGLPRKGEDLEAVPSAAERAAKQAYEQAGVGPQDLEVIEVHDAMAPAELTAYEELGLCAKGEGARYLDEGHPYLDGDHPVNPSGGLSAKGHPVGATGLAQIAEIVWQLRGEAAGRQVTGKDGSGPKLGLTQNGGGHIEGDAAAQLVHILAR